MLKSNIIFHLSNRPCDFSGFPPGGFCEVNMKVDINNELRTTTLIFLNLLFNKGYLVIESN